MDWDIPRLNVMVICNYAETCFLFYKGKLKISCLLHNALFWHTYVEVLHIQSGLQYHLQDGRANLGKKDEHNWLEKLQVTRIRSTTMMKIHVITKITSHWKQVVLELSEYIFMMTRTLARPVPAKLCSTAFSVESSICTQPQLSLISQTPKAWKRQK
jgi:hypothetical protein